ncbi:hypothetical protein [Flavobacterium sp.]|uniref:hypothetical protein n=1 Tax=Flavobacterium sp. TaxID=239 RepID=UPI003267BBCF
MKITKLCVLLFSITLFVACKKEEKPVEVIKTNTVEKETVIVKDTVKVVPKEEKATSVKINSDGVKVDSKNIDVEVK